MATGSSINEFEQRTSMIEAGWSRSSRMLDYKAHCRSDAYVRSPGRRSLLYITYED